MGEEMKKVLLLMILIMTLTGCEIRKDAPVETVEEENFYEYNNQIFTEDLRKELDRNQGYDYYGSPDFDSEKIGIANKENLELSYSIYTYEIMDGQLIEWYKIQLLDKKTGFAYKVVDPSEDIELPNGCRLITAENGVIDVPYEELYMAMKSDLASLGYFVVMTFHEAAHYTVISRIDGTRVPLEGDFYISEDENHLIANYVIQRLGDTFYTPSTFKIHDINEGFEESLSISFFEKEFTMIEWLEADLIHASFGLDTDAEPYEIVKNQVWIMRPQGVPIERYFSAFIPTSCVVDVTELNIRREPNTNSESVGKAEKGKTYMIKSIFIDSTRAWFQIDTGQWFASEFTTFVE